MKRDQSNLPENEKDYLRPIINFISIEEAVSLGFKLPSAARTLYAGQKLATIRSYDSRQRGVLMNWLDLGFLKSGDGTNLETSIFGYITSIRLTNN